MLFYHTHHKNSYFCIEILLLLNTCVSKQNFRVCYKELSERAFQLPILRCEIFSRYLWIALFQKSWILQHYGQWNKVLYSNYCTKFLLIKWRYLPCYLIQQAIFWTERKESWVRDCFETVHPPPIKIMRFDSSRIFCWDTQNFLDKKG